MTPAHRVLDRLPGSPPQRRLRRAVGWALVTLPLALALGNIPRYQGWDVSFYQAQTSSLVEDGDLDLRNDLLHVQSVPHTLHRQLTRVYRNGALINNRPVGPSVLWMPAYAASLPLRSADAGEAPPRWARPQLAALQLFSIGLMAWLFWALDRWLQRMGVRRWPAALAALALVMGTPLLIYGFRGFRGSHLASAVAVMWLVLAAVHLGRRPTALAALLCGVAAGMVFLCRWQDLVKAAVLVVPVLQLWRSRLPPRRSLGLAAAAAVGGALVAGLQLHAWLLERGEVFGMPQGKNYLRLADPELGRFLFSGLSSLLPWSPLFAIGLLGLLLPWRCRLPRSWRWVALGILLFDVYLNASVADWWGGASYGARRMCSDVPLLAVGLGNLLCFRRARLPAAALLALCCLWGSVTSNLFAHGLRDLNLLVSGRPSDAPGAEREGGAQPSPAEARALASSFPFQYLGVNYFPSVHRLTGRVLTVVVMALMLLLLAWGLSRARPPTLLRLTLLSCLVLVLFAHARLLADGRGDPDERAEWVQLVRGARDRPLFLKRLERQVRRGVTARQDRFSDARDYLWIYVWRGLDRMADARAVAARLAARGYPFGDRLLATLALGMDNRLLITRHRVFFEVGARQPAHAVVVNRQVDLRREPVRTRVTLEMGRVTAQASRLLLSWGRRGEDSLARVVAAGENRLVLVTDAGQAEADLPWRMRQSYLLELDWLPEERRMALSVTTAGTEPVRVSAPATVPQGEAGRVELILGSPSSEEAHEAPWRARYSELWMTARPVGPEDGAGRDPKRRPRSRRRPSPGETPG